MPQEMTNPLSESVPPCGRGSICSPAFALPSGQGVTPGPPSIPSPHPQGRPICITGLDKFCFGQDSVSSLSAGCPLGPQEPQQEPRSTPFTLSYQESHPSNWTTCQEKQRQDYLASWGHRPPVLPSACPAADPHLRRGAAR